MNNKLLEKYKKMSLPVRAALWFTICNLILRGISFITVPIFTRIMSDEEYGKLSMFLSFEQLIMILATWEIQMGAYQKGLFKYKEDSKFFTIATQATVNALSIIFFVILFVCNKYITNFTGMSIPVLIFLLIFVLLQPSYNCWLIRKRTSYCYRSSVIATISYALINVFIPMFALIYYKSTAEVKFIITLICSSLFFLAFYLPNSQYWLLFTSWTKAKKYCKFLIKFEAPLVLHSLSYLVLSQADRIMIGKMVGESEVAYYSVAYSLGSVVSLLQNSINQSLLPWMYQKLEEKRGEKIRKMIKSLLLLIGCLMLIFILIAPEIMKILFEENYYEAIWCIPPIVLGVYFMFLYSMFVNVETYYEKTQYVMYVSIICGLINIVLNYFCIHIWGYLACGYTTLICYILFAVGHYCFMKKTIKMVGVNEDVVCGKSILFISTGVVICGMLIMLLYTNLLLRYGVLSVAVLCLFVKRKQLTGIFKNFSVKKW